MNQKKIRKYEVVLENKKIKELKHGVVKVMFVSQASGAGYSGSGQCRF